MHHILIKVDSASQIGSIATPLTDDSACGSSIPVTPTTPDQVHVVSPVASTSNLPNVNCMSTPKGRLCTSSITIPTVWSDYTLKCLAEKRVNPKVRNEITHTLSVMMMAKDGGFPSSQQFEKVANAIVTQYPFLADPFGKSRAVCMYKLFHRIV